MRELAAAGSIRESVLVADGTRGWHLLLKIGMAERPLLTERGGVRRFGKLETAVALMRSCGISRLSIDSANFDGNERQKSLLVSTPVPVQQHHQHF